MRVLYALSLWVLASSSVLAIDYCRPTQSCWPSDAIVQDFKARMAATQARVMTKDDPDWVGKQLTFNLAVAKVPGLVVFVGTVDHIREALKFAYLYNIEVRVISSGHSFVGRSGDEGVMQISVHYMKGIDVDMNCTQNALGCMTVQSGVQWIEAYKEASKYDRLVVGGSAPTVSVSGWTLGGGHSPLSRMFGLGVDNVLRFHLVTADLSEVWTSADGITIKKEDGTVSQSNDTSLFWALRGGGSAFGIIIDMTIKMHKDNKIGVMNCNYITSSGGQNRLEVVLQSMGKLMLKAPNTFSGYILPSAGCSNLGCGTSVTISLLHYGAMNESADADWFAAFSALPHTWYAQGITEGGCYIAEHDSFYDYEMTVPNVTVTNVYLGGSLIQEDFLSDSVADIISDHYAETYKKAERSTNHAAKMLGTAIWVGGAVKDTAPGEAAVNDGWRKAIFTFSSAFAWDPNVVTDPSSYKEDVRRMHAALAPFSRGKYYNEAEGDMSPAQWKREFWGDDMYANLLSIKKLWDPLNRFSCNMCVGSDWDPQTDAVVG